MPSIKQDNKKEVRYLNRDFISFRKSLIDFSKIYYPNTYNDFNETSPGMMFMEMASYVGDVLSFYIDKQFKESLLPYAEERKNVVALANTLGYKPKPTVAARAVLDVYHTVPSITDDGGVTYRPDMRYALVIDSGMRVTAKSNGTEFRTMDTIDFRYSSSLDPTDITIYAYNEAVPTFYLLKKQVEAVAGTVTTETFTFTTPKKYDRRTLSTNDITDIINVTDSDGNTWYETSYLAQDTTFIDVENSAKNNPDLSQQADDAPYILKLKKVPRRFVKEVTSNNMTRLQFGAGISDSPDEEVIPNPTNVGSTLGTGVRNVDTSFDPQNFLFTKTYGQVPSNTTLTITYAKGGGISTNVPASDIVNISTYNTLNDLNAVPNTTEFTNAKNSLAVTNIKPATGGRSAEAIEEIRQNAISNFPAQNRAVTKEDYIVRCYSLPAKYGNISKVYIAPDAQLSGQDNTDNVENPNTIPNPFSLNFYCLGYDANKNLVNLTDTVKHNLRVYLSQYRMLTDAINLLNGYIVNIGVEFEIISLNNYNKREVVLRCVEKIKEFFEIDKWQINQPIVKTDLLYQLSLVEGVQNVTTLKFTNKVGGNYSNHVYDLVEAEPLNSSGDPGGIIYPSLDPMIFELKYPNIDIEGRAR